MEYILREGNIEREYKVEFDKEAMWNIINRLVRDGSYRVKGSFDLPYENRHEYKVGNLSKKLTLPNKDPLYEEVEEVYDYTSDSMCSYHGDTTAVKGVKVFAPKLAYLLRWMIEDIPCSVYDFTNYAQDEELIPIEEKIARANEKVDSISNFNHDEKVKALDELNELAIQKQTGQYFDTELLKECYEDAYNILNLSLVRETKTGFKTKVKLRTIEDKRKNGDK